MKVWTKIKLKEKNKDINLIANALVQYILKDSPINDIYSKYNIKTEEKKEVENYMASRIAGLLLLYFSKDTKRINDIVNKYNITNQKEISAELEGYVEK